MIKEGEVMERHPSAMLQSDAPAGPPPPSGFKKYAKSSMSGGVTTMIQNLIDDAEAMIKEAVKDETDSMTGYEEYNAGANKATRDREKGLTDRRARVGELEKFTFEAEERKKESEE